MVWCLDKSVDLAHNRLFCRTDGGESGSEGRFSIRLVHEDTEFEAV